MGETYEACEWWTIVIGEEEHVCLDVRIVWSSLVVEFALCKLAFDGSATFSIRTSKDDF